MNPIFKIVAAVLITAVVVAGGTFYFVNSKATTDKAALQTTINDLNANVTALNKKVADLAPVAATTTTTPSTTTITPAPAATTPDPTAGWKTYTDTTYKFSIQYPQTGSIEKSGDPLYGVGLLTAYDVNPGTTAITSLQVLVQDPAKVFTTNWNGTLTQSELESTLPGQTITSVTIDGRAGFISTQELADGTINVDVFLVNNGDLYRVIGTYGKTDTNSANTFKEIYSSLTFTN